MSGFIFPKGSCSSGKNTETEAIKTINRIFGVAQQTCGVIMGKKASENVGDEADKLAWAIKNVKGSAKQHHKKRTPQMIHRAHGFQFQLNSNTKYIYI